MIRPIENAAVRVGPAPEAHAAAPLAAGPIGTAMVRRTLLGLLLVAIVASARAIAAPRPAPSGCVRCTSKGL